MDIKVCKFNETYVRIETEPSISRELGEWFTITIPNANWGRFKNWNGKIRLYKQRERTIFQGLIPYIETFARHHGYTVTYDDDSLSHCNNISLFEIEKFCQALDLPFVPHKHQIDSITHGLRNKRILLVSPTASGKSLIIYVLVHLLLPAAIAKGQKLLIIVPTTNLVEQMYGDFGDYSINNKWNIAKYCHRIYEGYSKVTDKPVVISTWQSLATLEPEAFTEYMAVFGDEAHLCTAKVLQSIIGSCVSARYRIGTTGTIQDTKAHRLILEGLFGIIYKPTTTTKLIGEKKLSAFQIKCIVLNHQKQPSLSYRDELEYLFASVPRNKFIINLAMSLDQNTLLLYDLVEKHGLILQQMLNEVNKERKKQIYLIYGGTPVEEVQRIRAEMETRNDIILLASYKKFQMGANIKNLHNIIFASPSKSRIRVCQSIGRELRLHHTKDQAFVFDVSDRICYTKANYTLQHFSHRIQIYNSEKFNWKMYKVQLKE